MSFGLGHGRVLDDAPGVVGIAREEFPTLPDAALTDPAAGYLDPRPWFANPDLPLEIEIGPGKGTFLLRQAALQPETNFLGIEWAREFYLYAADRIRRAELSNVRLLRADASEFVRWRCAPSLAHVVHLYFSDPWPKARHHKNRVVQDRFLAECRRILVPGGELRIVTDHDDYWSWMEAHFARWCRPGGGIPSELRARFVLPAQPYERLPFTPPESAGRAELVGTNFERKYRVEGRAFHAAVLRALGP